MPQYATSLITFIRHVRKHRSKHGPPILTHCSAGVGRTGTFILLDSMLERLLVEDTLNVYEFLRQMRSKRVFMVQTVVSTRYMYNVLYVYTCTVHVCMYCTCTYMYSYTSKLNTCMYTVLYLQYNIDFACCHCSLNVHITCTCTCTFTHAHVHMHHPVCPLFSLCSICT